MNEMVKRLTAERDEARAKNAGWEAQAHRHRELADAAEQDAARLYARLVKHRARECSFWRPADDNAIAAHEERVGGGK